MKHIRKQGEPLAFANWKARANANWQPSYGVLPSTTKQAVKDGLMREQGWICCYCERRLTDSDSHIEHFKPQNAPAVDPLDFGNMLCSCQKQLERREPLHCGHLKGDWFDPNLLVSPLDPGCECKFRFSHDGNMEPMVDGDQAATETISRLGLNIQKLRAFRADVIEPFLDKDLTDKEIKTLVSSHLGKNSSGQFGEFWTTIRYLFA